uniref:PiggyBac transposable element-derived protein 4 C-terminal zinc-finger domain-containing protein n=1 Tax=Schizaphis graminum TaxID=13262 RepID=A0A2S2PLY3_SCHGA
MKREEKNFEDVNYAHCLDEVENEHMYFAQRVLDNLVSVLIHVLRNITNNMKRLAILDVIHRSSNFNLHYPRVVEKNLKGQKKRRRCILCSSRGLGQKRTDVYCSVCPGKPALCPGTCFITYHATRL